MMKEKLLNEEKGRLSQCTYTVEFFPVEWRSSLSLDGGIIHSITLHKLNNIRQMLNASFMDIMYYNSPQYREQVTIFYFIVVVHVCCLSV